MKRNVFLFTLLSLCLVFAMILPGCGDGDGDGDSSPSVLYDATGQWLVGWAPGADMGMLRLFLTQDASGNITGTVERATLTGGWDTGTITSGSNVNNAITITILFEDQMTLILEGTITDANNMSGSSRNYYGDPNTADTADWTATKASLSEPTETSEVSKTSEVFLCGNRFTFLPIRKPNTTSLPSLKLLLLQAESENFLPSVGANTEKYKIFRQMNKPIKSIQVYNSTN